MYIVGISGYCYCSISGYCYCSISGNCYYGIFGYCYHSVNLISFILHKSDHNKFRYERVTQQN